MIKPGKLILGLMTVFALTFTSCSSDDNGGPVIPEPSGDYEKGVFILNEGNFGGGNSSVSFYSSEGELTHEIYKNVNGNSLGDTAQSICFYLNKAYIIVNGSNKIEVVDRYTFESLGTVVGEIFNPRHMIVENGKGYVTNWGSGMDPDDDFISVIDLDTNLVMYTIPVAEGPDAIISAGGKVYVAHSGGFNYGNSVTVINAASDEVMGSVPTGDVPNSMVESGGKLYVLGSGKAAWTGEETAATITAINPVNNTVISTKEFPNGMHPSDLCGELGNLYFMEYNNIYQMASSANELPTTPYFTATLSDGSFGLYGFEVYGGKFYLGDAADFNSDGWVYIYDASGALETSFQTKVSPNGFYFNN